MAHYRNDAQHRPSRQLDDVFSGRVALRDAKPEIQSWARLGIYKQAERIVAMRSIDNRRRAIESAPETYREELKVEVLRLWQANAAR